MGLVPCYDLIPVVNEINFKFTVLCSFQSGCVMKPKLLPACLFVVEMSNFPVDCVFPTAEHKSKSVWVCMPLDFSASQRVFLLWISWPSGRKRRGWSDSPRSQPTGAARTANAHRLVSGLHTMPDLLHLQQQRS